MTNISCVSGGTLQKESAEPLIQSDAFIIPKNLEDTIGMMTSTDYKERFRGEYFQEKIRAEKLENFILKIEVGAEKDADRRTSTSSVFKNNQPQHDCPLELLYEQMRAMQEKLRVLKKRAVYENIKLE